MGEWELLKTGFQHFCARGWSEEWVGRRFKDNLTPTTPTGSLPSIVLSAHSQPVKLTDSSICLSVCFV